MKSDQAGWAQYTQESLDLPANAHDNKHNSEKVINPERTLYFTEFTEMNSSH